MIHGNGGSKRDDTFAKKGGERGRFSPIFWLYSGLLLFPGHFTPTSVDFSFASVMLLGKFYYLGNDAALMIEDL